MKIVLAITGASGAIYAQRLLDVLVGENPKSENRNPKSVEVHLITTKHSREVIALELPKGDLVVPPSVIQYDERDSMFVPFVSGSAKFDAMVLCPASMGMIGRIASGVSDSTITRAADVFLKERRKLILVPREAPFNLIHLRNMATLTEAGAVIIPASPSFYTKPKTLTEAADTVVARILDHLGVEHRLAKRWQSEE